MTQVLIETQVFEYAQEQFRKQLSDLIKNPCILQPHEKVDDKPSLILQKLNEFGYLLDIDVEIFILNWPIGDARRRMQKIWYHRDWQLNKNKTKWLLPGEAQVITSHEYVYYGGEQAAFCDSCKQVTYYKREDEKYDYDEKGEFDHKDDYGDSIGKPHNVTWVECSECKSKIVLQLS